ncbi:MAG: hypothetical protein U9P90_02490 [Patescibacteria group bacterium]|nr:hypothetical protein [Patescibacteria group bacterium]
MSNEQQTHLIVELDSVAVEEEKEGHKGFRPWVARMFSPGILVELTLGNTD